MLAAILTLSGATVLTSCGNVDNSIVTPQQPQQPQQNKYFTLWNPCEALTALQDYVKDVTNPASANFIPAEERIATFDMDGTFVGELYPTYFEYNLLEYRALDDPEYRDIAPEDVVETAQEIRDFVRNGKKLPDHFDMKHAYAAAKAYSGMTLAEFDAYVKAYAQQPANGFSGMTYGQSFYKPMLQVFDYLKANGFTYYVVSGSDRFICRALTEAIGIPSNRVIGMDVKLHSTSQGTVEGVDYTMGREEDLVRTDELIIKNLKTNKVLQISQEIGKVPVLSFGNSGGDAAMHNYALGNTKYKSAAFMLIADDDQRDHANREKALTLGEQWRTAGYHVISMRDNFKTIYGDGVTKTEFTFPADTSRPTVQRITERGTLLVGTTGDYRPLSYREADGNYWGFGIELAQKIAERLGVDIAFAQTSWPTLTADVQAEPQTFDLAIGGITITDARKETMLMSDGYLCNGKTILCRADESDRFQSLADIDQPEVRVMVNPGGLNEKFANENLTHAQIIVHQKNEEIPSQVAEGHADVMITEITEAPWYVQNDPRLATPLLAAPFTHGEIGVLMRKGQDDLLTLVNSVIAQMKTDGTLRQLHEKYGLVYGY